jgi:hypothetical protein
VLEALSARGCSLDNQSSSTTSKPQLSPYQTGVQKALKQAGEQHTLEALQQGVPAQHIEQQAGLSQQDVLNQILQLSQSQVKAKPEAGGGLLSGHIGLIGGLLNAIQGKGFNPMDEKTEPLGLTNAIALQNAMESGQKAPLERQKLQGDIAQQPLQQQKLATEVEQMNPEYKATQAKKEAQAKGSFLSANDLFGKFESAVQPYIVQRDAYARIQQTGQEPSPAGDLALLYGYMKILDPGSTVREGEFATAQNAGSIPQRLGALYNKVISGTRLTDVQRKDFLSRSRRIFDSAQSQYGKTRKEYTKLAIANQLDPNAMIRDVGLEETKSINETPKTSFSKDKEARYQAWKKSQVGA